MVTEGAEPLQSTSATAVAALCEDAFVSAAILLAIALAAPPDDSPLTALQEIAAAHAARDRGARCHRVDHVAVRIDSIAGAAAQGTVEVESEVWTDFRPAASWREYERASVRLRRVDGRWETESWERADDAFVEQWVAAADAERDRLLTQLDESLAPSVVQAASRLGVSWVVTARIAEAQAAVRLARVLADRLGDARSEAATSSLECAFELNRPNYKRALALAQQSLAAAQSAGDPDLLVVAWYRLGRALEIGSPNTVEPYERALALAPFLSNVAMAAFSATQLAAAADHRRDHRAALRYAEMAATYARQAKAPRAMLNAELNFAGTYSYVGDTRLMIAHYEKALVLARETHVLGSYGFILAQLLLAYRWVDDKARLAELSAEMDNVISIFDCSEVGFWMRVRRAQYRGVALAFDEAERDLSIALDTAVGIRRADLEGAAYLGLAGLRIRQNRAREALAFADRAWANIPDLTATLEMRGLALARLGDLPEAVDTLRAASELFARTLQTAHGTRQREHAGDSRAGMATALVETLFDAGRIEEALSAAEERRAIVLRAQENAARPQRSAEEARLDREIARENLRGGADSHAKLASARAELAHARARTESLASPRPEPFPFDPTFPALQPGEAILEYVVGLERTLVFAVVRDRSGVLSITPASIDIPRTQLRQEVDLYRDAIMRRELSHAERGRRLYDLLIAPLGPSLRQVDAITIVPDDSLWLLPFHTLREQGRVLLDRFIVGYTPSAASIPPKARSSTARNLLAIANANAKARGSLPALPPIPESEREVRSVAALYQPLARVHVGNAARESVLQSARGYAVVHIASHTLLDQHEPMASALLLTPDAEGEDGMLEARELADLHLDADVVVLSACNTAGSRPSREGMIGLARAALLAGARTAVVSQWNTDSAATEKLMVALHKRIAKGMAPPRALREAALELKEDPRYSHPFDWAAFIVVAAP